MPYFMEARKGYITFTSSVMGFMAVMGYTTYCPSKFAIFGLAEALRHELLPYKIKVSILFPTDTDTPGYAEENKTKPEECKIMSSVGTVMTAEQVAEEFIDGILNERFEILPGEAAVQMKEMRENPDQIRGVLDSLYKRARRKIKRKSPGGRELGLCACRGTDSQALSGCGLCSRARSGASGLETLERASQ